MKYKLFFVFTLIFILGCSRSPVFPVQKRLSGLWIIEKIINPVTNQNERYNIGVNSFSLDEDKSCILPEYKWQGGWTMSGDWDCKIVDLDTILVFKSKCRCN